GGRVKVKCRQDGDVRDGIWQEGQGQHTVRRVGGLQPCNVDQVGHHGGRGRHLTGALPVVKRRPDNVTMHQYCIHGTVDRRQRAVHAYQCRVHAQLDTVVATARNAKQLDAVTQPGRVLDIFSLQLRDAFYACFIKLNRDAGGEGSQQSKLVRGIDPFDIEGRVGLCIPQSLRLGQHTVERQAARLHFGKNVVGRTVDNPGNPIDTVGGEALAHCLNDRNAAGYRRLKGHHHTMLIGSIENFIAMQSEQRFVGRDYMLALLDGFHYPFAGDGFPADELNHDIDIRIARDLQAVSGNFYLAVAQQLRCLLDIAHRYRRDLYAPPGTPGDLFGIALQHLPSTAPYDAQA